MMLLSADFLELYRRHLCRHSQFGINVLHLVAVVGIYVSLFCIALSFAAGPWIIGAVLSVYFVILAVRIPPLVLSSVVVTVGLMLGIALSLPQVSVWIHVACLVAWHRFQVWNHRIYPEHHDMSDFAGKYRKGPELFFVLAVYELPILLNYLLFSRRKEATT